MGIPIWHANSWYVISNFISNEFIIINKNN